MKKEITYLLIEYWNEKPYAIFSETTSFYYATGQKDALKGFKDLRVFVECGDKE